MHASSTSHLPTPFLTEWLCVYRTLNVCERGQGSHHPTRPRTARAADLAMMVAEHDQTARLHRARRRIAGLENERFKLVQMAYADAIPLDVLKVEQLRVSRELEQANRDEREAQDSSEGVMDFYDRARDLMLRAAHAYRIGGPNVRRLLAQAFLARIEIDTDGAHTDLASPWAEIQRAAAHVRRLSARPPERHLFPPVGRGKINKKL